MAKSCKELMTKKTDKKEPGKKLSDLFGKRR